MKTRSKVWFIAWALISAAATQAADTVLYQDDFSGTADAPLNGTAPDVRPGAEVWASADNFYADGHFRSSIVPLRACLPFTLKKGNIYTFSADVRITNPDDITDWAGIAIRTNNFPGKVPAASIALGPAYMFVRRNGSITANTIGAGKGVVVSNAPGSVASGETARLGMIIDATNIESDNWTVTFTWNGNIFAAEKPLSNEMMKDGAVYYWCIGNFNSAAGVFDNLSVTVSPKPVTVGSSSVPGTPEPVCSDRRVRGAVPRRVS